MAFDNIQFAKFASTRRSPDFKTIAETGEILHNRYMQNRENISLINQSLNNLDVEDRNQGIVENVKIDVNSMIGDVVSSGKYHRGTNAIYNAKDRVVNDRALNAAITSKAKRDAFYSELKKQSSDEKSGITNEAISAAAIYDSISNSAPISIDPDTGILQNEWTAPMVPPKPDAEKMAKEIATSLKPEDIAFIQRKSNGEVMVDAEGNPMTTPTIFQQHPALEGFIVEHSREGVTEERIATAISRYIESNPAIGQYHAYINGANIIAARMMRDSKTGATLKNESGTPILADITPAMFRNAGINVDDAWNLNDNKGKIIDKEGEEQSVKIENAPINLLDNEYVKEALAKGEDVNDILSGVLNNYLTQSNLQGYVDYGTSFANSKLTSKTVKDDLYHKRLEWAREDEQKREIVYTLNSPSTLFKPEVFDTKDYNNSIAELTKDLRATPSTDTERAALLEEQIREKRAELALVSNAYMSGDGGMVANRLWNEFIERTAGQNDNDIMRDQKDKFLSYLSGEADIPDFDQFLPEQKGGYTNRGLYTEFWGKAKRRYQRSLTKAVKEDGVSIYTNTNTLLDKYGQESKVNTALGDFVYKQGGSFTVMGLTDKDGEVITFSQFLNENKINTNQWEIHSAPADPNGSMYGAVVMSFVPKPSSTSAKSAEADKRTPIRNIIVIPNPEVRGQVASTIGQIITDNAANQTMAELGQDYAISAAYGHIRDKIRNEVNLSADLSNDPIPTANRNRTYTFKNVPYGKDYYTLKVSPITVDKTGAPLDKSNYKYKFTLIGANGITSDLPFYTSDIDEAIRMFGKSSINASLK
jgi:hypothetical protein